MKKQTKHLVESIMSVEKSQESVKRKPKETKQNAFASKEKSRKYIRFLSYAFYFYFGMTAVVMPVLYLSGIADEFVTLFDLVISLVFAGVGIFATYHLHKHMKRWALVTLVVLVALNIVSQIAVSAVLGGFKIPLTRIAFLIAALAAFKHLKHAE